MGVPKFFRYISERYPNLSELIGSTELPQFDNMYLDMNGIIHVCSHPDDSNVHFRMSEDQMFRDILHYIDTLFHLIKPRKLFFMAVDGVAPRAKMNQQRSRRFQSARTALELIEKAKKANEKLPEESRFDSNCITPGTEFMERLQQAFKHFVKLKLSTDPAWKHCRIILSGHETPGEGEHKVMEYIRYLKAQPNYDPNTRHCLYGLDADLIMLGLCTHELNFALLREEVKFDKNAKRAPSVDETKFFLLHLGLLREYLELEFIELKPALRFEYDMEKIIDDWIFMCFMVGNDFLPNLPNLHINSNALPILYKTYKTVLPKLDGYMNEGGKLNLKRFEVFMDAMSEVDRDLFRTRYEDLKYMDSKCNDNETFGNPVEITAETKSDLAELIKKTNFDFGSDDSSVEGSDSEGDFMFSGQDPKEVFKDCEEEEEVSDEELFEREFNLHKRDYYITKMKYPEMTEEVLVEQTQCYITALQWTLSYYYRGVCSWSWFYPHHYAPYMSDIKNFKHLQLEYVLNKPFLPFEQLLSVLPAASKDLLPKVYHALMTDVTSKIIDYYPVDFETDLNGKKQEWEALVLIPFINEMRLMDAMNDCNDKLNDDERNRNRHGPMLQYDYCETDQGSLPPCGGQQLIGHVFCKETKVDLSELRVPEEELVLGPCPGAQKEMYFPGFPTMRHLKHSGKLEMKKIKVFQQPTRNESMVIRIDETPAELSIQEFADHFLGKEVYVGWPHLREAKVFAVSDEKTKIDSSGVEKFDANGNGEFRLLAKHIIDHNMLRLGVDLGEIKQLLHVYPLLNREYLNTGDGKLTLTKNWSKIAVAIAPITVIEHLNVFATDLERFKRFEDVFTKGSTVFLMNKGFYGCQATIFDSKFISGRIKLQTKTYQQPDFDAAKQLHRIESKNYFNSYAASTSIGFSPHLFNRITGVVFIYCGQKRYPISDADRKVNVGLQLKHFKQNEEVPGYTRSLNNQWLYSQAAIDVVDTYAEKFPRLFEMMDQQTNAQTDPIFESDLCDGQKEGEESVLKQIQNWLKDQPCRLIARQPCGTSCLSRPTIKLVADTVENLEAAPVKLLTLQVRPQLLYKPNLNEINVMPDASVTFELFDRVVIARDQYTVPLGTLGTIISILPIVDPNPIRQENINLVEHLYEVLFDKPFELGTSLPDIVEKRVFKVRKSVLINITHGLGRPVKEQNKHNGNNSRQRNAPANEAPPPNAWKLLEKPSNSKPAPKLEHYSANAKAKNPPTKQLKALKLTDKSNKVAENTNKPIPANAVTEADLLKKMLGVGQQKTVNPAPTAANGTQRVDLNSLFAKADNVNSTDQQPPAISSLPLPPPSWHPQNKQTNSIPQNQQPPPEQQPHEQLLTQSNLGAQMNMAPQMLPTVYYRPPNMVPQMPFIAPHVMAQFYRHPMMPVMPGPHFPMPIDPHGMPIIPGPRPFIQTPHQIRMSGPPFHVSPQKRPHHHQMNVPMSPEGPQKLKNKNETSSAFIPLQAARKCARGKSNGTIKPNEAQNVNTHDDEVAQDAKKPVAQPAQVNNNPAKPVAAKPAITADDKTKANKGAPVNANNRPAKRLAINFAAASAPEAK